MTKQIPAAEVARLAREIRCSRRHGLEAIHFNCDDDPSYTCTNCTTRRALLKLCGEE